MSAVTLAGWQSVPAGAGGMEALSGGMQGALESPGLWGLRRLPASLSSLQVEDVGQTASVICILGGSA